MAGPGKDYVVGKGRLLFDQFAFGSTRLTGERYLGNTPELTTTADAETLDHYDADQGLNVKDESITIENNLTGSFVTDNISVENVALFFSGTTDMQIQTSQVGKTDTFTGVKKGRFYQLGVSDATPTGVRHVDNVVATVGGSTVGAADIEIDLERGRIYIETDAPGIDEDDNMSVTYDVNASTRTLMIGRGDEIRGALRFLSNNPVGSQKDYYWPYVKITPNGDFALKSSEWQQIGFSFEVLKLTNRERVYAETAAILAGTANSPATGTPTISGTAQVGQVLTANTSSIADADGLGAFTYAWLRAGGVIAGATSSTYTPVVGDVGSPLSVRVSFVDGKGNSEMRVSAATANVIAA